MTATILPPSETAFFRSIAKTAAVLLICLRIDELYPGRAIADHEIADILEVDPRTVNKQLRSLSAYGLVLEQLENKYVVTPLGKNTLFSNRQSTSCSIVETENISGFLPAHTQCVPHDDDESIQELKFKSSSSTIESTNCAKILEATHLLFETAVNSIGITDRSPEHALAWISKAFADKGKLNNPQGLVYARLRDNVRPPVYLLKDPTQGLPDDYLAVIGRERVAPKSGSGSKYVAGAYADFIEH